MKIYPAGHAPSRSGPPDWFTGRVRLDPLFNPNAPEIPTPPTAFTACW
jgi:hypothetical protein